MTKSIKLKCPENFSFKHTVYGHGWGQLSPFELDEENWILGYVFTDNIGLNPTAARISNNCNNLEIELDDAKIDDSFLQKILSDIRHIFRLDDDFDEFYKLTNRQNDLKWIEKANAGRLIRSPTVFEDLIKTICTTNCSWGLTKTMTKNLVEKLGVEGRNGKKSFPTAEIMANQTEEFYREEIRAGYRSPYFVELSDLIAVGKVDPESWLDSEFPTAELKKEMKSIKGVGDYAAENLLKLVGRYEGLALDSWLRAQFYKKYADGKVCDDKTITEYYNKFGNWKGLVMWCDMTERWLKIEQT